MKTILLVSGSMFLSSFLFSQKEADNWVFGYNSGITWNNGPASFISGSVINQNEGVASISDTTGQMLFYTDGVTIRNRLNQVMLNGTGLNGNFSSTQSALIVPRPGNSSIFYVFTTDAEGGANGLCYSVVDMSLDGGKGAVTIKNRLLYTPVCEKLTATLHANGQDVWVISHRWNSSSFYSYLITSSGGQMAPVVSNIAGAHFSMGGNANRAYGYMKASPDGKKLAVAVWGIGGWLDILDFDNQTGIPSGPLTDYAFSEHGPYGLEFSPDSRFLYVSEMNYKDSSHLFQYDLQATNAVIASRMVIASGMTYDNCGMQLALDGRIYVATYPHHGLNVIQQPDLRGVGCGYQKNGMIWSGSSYSQLGLPNFVASYFCEKQKLQISVSVDTGSCDNLCTGSIHVKVAGGTPPYQYLWQPGNYSGNELNGLCSGQYALTITDAAGHKIFENISLGRVVTEPVKIFTQNKFICANDTALICASPGFKIYLWNTGETSSCILSGLAGNYQVTAIDNKGCSVVSDHLSLTVLPPPVVSVSVDGNKIYTIMPSNYQWYLNGVIINGANSAELTANESGFYWLEVKDTNGCVARSSPVYLTGLEELNNDFEVNISPNPSTGENLHISVNDKLLGGYVDFCDTKGQLINSLEIKKSKFDIPIGMLPKGIYLLRVNASGRYISRKLIRL